MKHLKLLSTSDWHLGYRRVDNNYMTHGFRETLLPYIKKCNMFTIVGDVFDFGLGLSDQPMPVILAFLMDILMACEEHGVIVRIVRGTFSHERTQAALLPILHERAGFKNNLRYFDTVSLEYIKELDLRVLYIPDDVPAKSSDEIVETVKEQMEALGWDYVDYAFIHGNFDHALPNCGSKPPPIVFRNEQFSFVRRKIMVGHIHHPSINGDTIYHGSLDRLFHGEEEKKGAVYIDDDGKHIEITFVENKYATTFKTLDYSKIDDEDTLMKTFREYLDTLPTEGRPSFVRVIHPKQHVRMSLLKSIAAAYPKVVYSAKSNEKEVDPQSDTILHLDLDEEDEVAPTIQTLPSLVMQILEGGCISTSLTRDRVSELLKSLEEE